jgi:hypothetical protein
MVRIGLGIVLFGTLLWGAVDAAPKLNDKFSDSSKCKSCHMPIVQKWEDSYHAKSHYNSDEYLRQSMDYVSRKTRKSLNAVKVQCAACHNPRIAVTETGIDYEIAAVMKLDKGSKVNRALASDALSEGINCLVCHNIDKINEDVDPSKRGIHRIGWNPVGTMSGPIGDAKSPYHKIQYRDFFGKDSKKLCFVCHANDRSVEGLVFANTEKEYGETSKQCADCHMGPKKEGIASTLPIDNGKPKKRMVRDHGFVGAHTNWMWKGALELRAKTEGNDLLVTLTNRNPHNIPTGFGSRELLVEVEYKAGERTIKKDSLSLTRQYTDKRGKPTIPHLAHKASKDLSVPANSSRTFKIAKAEGAGRAEITLSYRLVNDEVRSLLDLKEAQWSEKKFIDRVDISF